MLDCETQDLKMYELVLFNNIFDQVFKRLLGSFFLVFPGRRLSNTFEIQIDLKMKHPWKPLHKHSELCQTSEIMIFAQVVNSF